MLHMAEAFIVKQRIPSFALVPILIGLLWAGVGGPVSAQERQTCGAELQGGPLLPVGELADTVGPGATFGLSLGCRVLGRFSLGAGIHLGGHPGGSGMARLLVNPELALSEPGTSRWVVSVRMEGGYTWPYAASRPDVLLPPGSREREDLVPDQGVTAGIGSRVSRQLSEHFGFFADAGLRVLFDTSDDVVASDRRIEGFGWPVTLPVTIGLNVGF